MLIINPSSAMVAHRGAPGGAGPSPGIWGRMNGQAMQPDGGDNMIHLISDDFMGACLLDTDTTRLISEAGIYTRYGDTGCTLTNLVSGAGGVLRMLQDGTGNDEQWLQYGGATTVLGKISDTPADAKLTGFEAKFCISSVATSGIFIGMSEENLASADNLVDTTTALISKDLIGFYVDYDAPTTGTFVYRIAGGVMQTAVSSILDANGTAVTLAVDTWYKVGFLYDPTASSAKKVRFFFNGVEQSSYVTATQIAAATFPDGEEMTFLAGLKNVAATATTMDLDWWYYYQEA